MHTLLLYPQIKTQHECEKVNGSHFTANRLTSASVAVLGTGAT